MFRSVKAAAFLSVSLSIGGCSGDNAAQKTSVDSLGETSSDSAGEDHGGAQSSDDEGEMRTAPPAHPSAGNGGMTSVGGMIASSGDNDPVEGALGDVATTIPRGMYPYSFGGLDALSARNAAELIMETGYVGVAVKGRGDDSRARLGSYYELSREYGEQFSVTGVFMGHPIDRLGTSVEEQKATIDVMAGEEGDLWVYFRDDSGTVPKSTVVSMVREILDYAVPRGVRVALYPHYLNVYPSATDGIELVEEIDHPDLGIVFNLNHELLAFKGDELEETFARVKHKIFAVNISGAKVPLDLSGGKPVPTSSILPLDESEFDLAPVAQLIADSGFEGPVGFLNFAMEDPGDYLPRSFAVWSDLCLQAELYQP